MLSKLAVFVVQLVLPAEREIKKEAVQDNGHVPMKIFTNKDS